MIYGWLDTEWGRACYVWAETLSYTNIMFYLIFLILTAIQNIVLNMIILVQDMSPYNAVLRICIYLHLFT